MPSETVAVKTEACLHEAKEKKETGFYKVLVAMDHSRHAALKAALQIAIPGQTQVILVNVVEPLVPMSVEVAFDAGYFYNDRRDAAKNMLQEVRAELPAGIAVVAAVRDGFAGQQIVAAADEFHADLIVMGTHRKGAIARMFLGSASQDVLKHARCPVMFVSDV
jgi:nucleotide-binding universal stress UspA family protein